MTKTVEKRPTLSGRTYLYSPCKGVSSGLALIPKVTLKTLTSKRWQFTLIRPVNNVWVNSMCAHLLGQYNSGAICHNVSPGGLGISPAHLLWAIWPSRFFYLICTHIQLVEENWLGNLVNFFEVDLAQNLPKYKRWLRVLIQLTNRIIAIISFRHNQWP